MFFKIAWSLTIFFYFAAFNLSFRFNLFFCLQDIYLFKYINDLRIYISILNTYLPLYNFTFKLLVSKLQIKTTQTL